MNDISQKQILSLFQTDKIQRKSFVDNVLMQLSEGEIDAIQLHLQLKCMEDICEQIKGNSYYKSNIVTEAEKNGKKFTYQNAEFQIKEAGTKYDYSKCNDLELSQMQQQAEELAKKIKIRQDMLKNASAEGLQTVTSEGEVCVLYPPSKSSTTIVQVTLK